MTFLTKFLVKGIALFALEAGETISDIASHMVSPAKLGYQLATHMDLSSPEDTDAAQTKKEHLIRSRYGDHTLVSKIKAT